MQRGKAGVIDEARAMTDWRDAFIAVDWGTTNRRAYLVERDGSVRSTMEDGCGVVAVSPRDFEPAIAEIRARLGDEPMLLAGMVGSNRGWIETPYVSAPAGLPELVRGVVRIDERTAIVPGLCLRDKRFDIMRGEEVQVLGAVAAGLAPATASVCHPGTHTKWIALEQGRLRDFRTAMTGELFALLEAHSIVQLTGAVDPGEAFIAGVETVRAGEPLLDALFSVRSRVMLGALAKEASASYASGVLIGVDVATHAQPGEAVRLIGRVDLCALYAVALERHGCTSCMIDGAQAFVAGMHAMRTLLP